MDGDRAGVAAAGEARATAHDLREVVNAIRYRERAGRDASPTAAVIDSQSVKAPSAKARGFDAAKKIVGLNATSPRMPMAASCWST